MNIKIMYMVNPDFKSYVDKCANSRNLSVEEVLSLALTKRTYEYYLEEKENESSKCRI